MRSATAVIVGGGIVGAALAWELRQAGWGVTLIEKDEIFAGASSRAAGILGFDAEALDKPGAQWTVDARDQWFAWYDNLQEFTGLSADVERVGILRVLTEHEDVASALALSGPHVRVVARDAMPWADRYRPPMAGALFFAHDGRVDPRRLGRMLERALDLSGVRIITAEPVQTLLTHGPRVEGVVTTSETLRGDLTIVAAGVKARDLLAPLDIALPVKPVRGQIIQVEQPPWWPPYVVETPEFYAVPRSDKTLVVGSTWEEGVESPTATLEGVSSLSRSLQEAFPALSEAPLLQAWGGVRPVSEDGWPFLGPVAGWDGLVVAVGHGAHGVMWAPWTAMVVASMIEGRWDPSWDRVTARRLG
ncbi:MAG: FAD-dependent oxidoreductase [Firmicutes bacterium]|nr:FAD-dependent oxidoreductase [Bacillota bacterium]